MSRDWRELLDRALEGDELSASEAEALAAALASGQRRPEALSLVCFEAQLRRLLAPGDAVAVLRGRERLLAKAVLREKAHRVRAARSLPRRWAVAIAAAAALLLAAIAWLLTRGGGGYPEPQARGDYRVIGGGAPAVARGQRLAAGPGGAELNLGGYCRLRLDPSAQVLLQGAAGAEAVELERGRVVSEVQPRRGRFELLTPIGRIEVKGTKFITSVEYPNSLKGEHDMGTLRKSAVVTVMVVSGMVACHFGEVALLGAGMSQVFAGHEEERATLPAELRGFKGILVGTITSPITREFNLKIEKIATVWPQSKADAPERAVGKTIEVVVGENRMLEQHLQTLSGLRKGDRVIVEAFDVQGFRLTVMELFRKAEGEGEPREKTIPHEGHGEVREKKARHEGHGEAEVREKKVRSQGEGEGEWREKKTEPRSEGLREFEGWVKATPDQGGGVIKVVERIKGEEGVREKVSQYRIRPDEAGKRLIAEADGRRAAVVGALAEGDLGLVLAVKKFRVQGAPDEPRRDKPVHRDGEAEVREKKIRRDGEGEGEWREKKIRRDGEGEGEWREKKIRRDGEREGEASEKVRDDGAAEDKPAPPRAEGSGLAPLEAIEGFRGMLEGVVVGKTKDALVLRVERVSKVWQTSSSKSPEALAGKIVTLSLGPDGHRNEALVKALGELKAGDRVAAGAIHRDGRVLALAEVLRKLEAE